MSGVEEQPHRSGLVGAAALGAVAGTGAFALGPGLASLTDPPASATAPVGDTAMALSGAQAFIADRWRWPLFDFEGLSESHATNAVFTDSIPLYAAAWKLLGVDAPGSVALFVPVWVLILFLWQGAAAGMGLRLLGVARAWPLLAGALVVALWPAFLHRIPLHIALAAHGFVVLAAAMMLARPTDARAVLRRVAGWTALLVAAVLVHGYLMVMAAAAYVVQGLVLLGAPPPGLRRPALLALGLVPLGALAATMAAAGYFAGVPGEAGGFGHFRLNLAAPFLHGGDSLLPEIMPIPDGQKSGYAYVPLGGLALLTTALALWALGRGRPAAPRLTDGPAGRGVLVLGLAAVLLFATAGRLSWGESDLATIPLPDAVERLGDVLRGSGRFVWLPLYAALLLALARIAAAGGPARASQVFALAAALIAVEMAPLRARVHPDPGEFSADPVLAKRIASAERIAVLPAWGCDPLHYPGLDKEIQFHASLAGARMVNSFAAARLRRRCEAAPEPGFASDPGNLLILKRGAAGLGPAARAGVDTVRCRAHRGLALCGADLPQGAMLGPVPAHGLAPPVRLSFGSVATADAHLGAGFGAPERWGVWTVAERAEIPLALAEGTRVAGLRLTVRGHVPEARPATAARIALETRPGPSAAWRPEAERTVTLVRGWGPQTVAFGPLAGSGGQLRLVIRPEAPISPAELGTGKDRRRLGVGVVRLEID